MNFKIISCHCVVLFLTVSALAQNVGLGTNTPNGRLQFKNEIFNRLLVLNESGNNEHNFFGFGINEFTLRYQVADPAQSHVFFAGNAANATGSNELLRIRGNGNIGIGYNNPQRPLSFPPLLGKKISLYPGGVGDAGFSVWGNELRIHSDNPNAAITFGVDAYNAPQFAERMRITGSGNVGIGLSNPTAPLQFATDTRNRKVVLWSVTNNDHQFYGLGVNDFTLRYQTPAATDDHVFFAGASEGSSNELFRIRGTGALGVGPNGSTGQLGLVLTSKGPNNSPQWEPARQLFVVYQNGFTSFSFSKVDLAGAVAEFTLTRAARVKFDFGVAASFFNCFACGNKRVNLYLEQNVSGGTQEIARRVFIVPENLDFHYASVPAVVDLPAGTYSFKLAVAGGGVGQSINATASGGTLIWEIYYQ